MKSHLLDTNILSRYLSKVPNFVDLVNNGIGLNNICTSVVVKIELLNWLSNYKYLTIKERSDIKKFINQLPLIHINENISKLADNYMIKDINSKPADTLIGATAQYYNMVLVSTNLKDFKDWTCFKIKAKDLL